MVPQVREIEDYNANQSALQLSSTARYKEIDPVNSAYIRNQDLFAPQTMEQVLTSYDLDDQDEQWLAKYNAKVCEQVQGCGAVMCLQHGLASRWSCFRTNCYNWKHDSLLCCAECLGSQSAAQARSVLHHLQNLAHRTHACCGRLQRASARRQHCRR